MVVYRRAIIGHRIPFGPPELNHLMSGSRHIWWCCRKQTINTNTHKRYKHKRYTMTRTTWIKNKTTNTITCRKNQTQTQTFNNIHEAYTGIGGGRLKPPPPYLVMWGMCFILLLVLCFIIAECHFIRHDRHAIFDWSGVRRHYVVACYVGFLQHQKISLIPGIRYFNPRTYPRGIPKAASNN